MPANFAGADALATGQQPTTEMPAARAFRGQHQPKALPFNPAKLSGISEKLIRSHWENNYGGAVKASEQRGLFVATGGLSGSLYAAKAVQATAAKKSGIFLTVPHARHRVHLLFRS